MMLLPTTSIPSRSRAHAGPRPQPAVPRALAGPAGSARRDLELRFEHEALPHMPQLYAAATRLVSRAHDAEDLVQETYLRAFRAFHSFEPGTNIRAWLYTILYRVRADYFRKVARSPRTVELVHESPAVAPEQDALASGHEVLYRALARLQEPFKSAVVLRDMQDLSYEEIAAVLGVPIGTVMSRIHRGRALLRAMLQEGQA